MRDGYGRPLTNFRIAVTQECNLECFYCHKEGQYYTSTQMEPTEIARITGIATDFGVRNVKITGGEPLLREDLSEIIRLIHRLPKVEEVSLVTNARLLTSQRALDLKKNGLARVNISLPSIIPETYCRVTGGKLCDAINGVRAAIQAGLNPVKINMVVVHSVNEDEINPMIHFSRNSGIILQLIELEPVNIDRESYNLYHHSLESIERDLAARSTKVESRPFMQGRRIYTLEGARVEIVKPVENTSFCMQCTRMRLTSDGKLKPCLMRNDNLVDILTPLRKGESDDCLHAVFGRALEAREPFHKVMSRSTDVKERKTFVRLNTLKA